MSILNHSPTIVRDGLILCLDAGAVRSYPGNLVTNGAFDADSDWTKGTNWTIGSGAASHTAGTASDLTQAVSKLVEGKSYVCTYTISSYSAGDVRLVLGGTNGTYRGVTGGAQTWRETLTCGSTDSNVKFYGHTAFVGSIDNVIVQEATWSDLSGNFNNGTLVNEPVFSAESGAGGTKSFDFDGSSDSINLGDSDSFSFGDGSNDSPFTVAAWFYAGTLGRVNPIVTKGGYNNDVGEWHLKLEADNKMYLFLADESLSSTYERAYTTAALGGGWTHIVATYNGVGGTSANAGIAIYVNGDSQGLTLSGAGSYVAMENLGADLLIGKYVDSSTNHFDGKISIVHLYNRALTATEVAQNYRTHKGRFGR